MAASPRAKERKPSAFSLALSYLNHFFAFFFLFSIIAFVIIAFSLYFCRSCLSVFSVIGILNTILLFVGLCALATVIVFLLGKNARPGFDFIGLTKYSDMTDLMNFDEQTKILEKERRKKE